MSSVSPRVSVFSAIKWGGLVNTKVLSYTKIPQPNIALAERMAWKGVEMGDGKKKNR